jgi:hypothetical protein
MVRSYRYSYSLVYRTPHAFVTLPARRERSNKKKEIDREFKKSQVECRIPFLYGILASETAFCVDYIRKIAGPMIPTGTLALLLRVAVPCTKMDDDRAPIFGRFLDLHYCTQSV